MESKNPKIAKIKNEKVKLLSKCAVCDSKKSRFIEEQEVRLKTPLSQIAIVGHILF